MIAIKEFVSIKCDVTRELVKSSPIREFQGEELAWKVKLIVEQLMLPALVTFRCLMAEQEVGIRSVSYRDDSVSSDTPLDNVDSSSNAMRMSKSRPQASDRVVPTHNEQSVEQSASQARSLDKPSTRARATIIPPDYPSEAYKRWAKRKLAQVDIRGFTSTQGNLTTNSRQSLPSDEQHQNKSHISPAMMSEAVETIIKPKAAYLGHNIAEESLDLHSSETLNKHTSQGNASPSSGHSPGRSAVEVQRSGSGILSGAGKRKIKSRNRTVHWAGRENDEQLEVLTKKFEGLTAKKGVKGKQVVRGNVEGEDRDGEKERDESSPLPDSSDEEWEAERTRIERSRKKRMAHLVANQDGSRSVEDDLKSAYDEQFFDC